MEKLRIDMERLKKFGMSFLKAKGVPESTASVVTDIVVQTEAMGIHTHGLKLFPYFENMIPDELNPVSQPQVVREKASTALIDAREGFSQLAMKLAKEIAMKKAVETGIAMVGIKNALWMGAMGPYLFSIAENGFFAQLWSQTSTCLDCAPFGGIDGRFSTNPLALAFPGGKYQVVSDFSTAMMSMGKLNQLIRDGKRAPEKAFMDREGKLTDDPHVVPEGGTLLFFGGENYGYKGYALSLWAEALTTMNGGSANNPKAKTRQTISLTVIDPNAFEGNDYYYREIERFLAHVKSSRLRFGFERIRFPGERAGEELERSKKEGVAVEADLFESLSKIAEKYGLPSFS